MRNFLIGLSIWGIFLTESALADDPTKLYFVNWVTGYVCVGGEKEQKDCKPTIDEKVFSSKEEASDFQKEHEGAGAKISVLSGDCPTVKEVE